MAQLTDATTALEDVAAFGVFYKDILKHPVLLIRQQAGQQTGEGRGFDEFHITSIYANGG